MASRKNARKRPISPRSEKLLRRLRSMLIESLERREVMAGVQLIGIQPNLGDLLVGASLSDGQYDLADVGHIIYNIHKLVMVVGGVIDLILSLYNFRMIQIRTHTMLLERLVGIRLERIAH